MINTFNDETEIAGLMEQVYKNTNFPTFEQFAKDPQRWRKNQEDIFESLSMMNVFFKERVASVSYFWRGKYKCKTLEELQKMTQEEGYRGSDLEYQPKVTPLHGSSNLHNSKMQVTVNVYSKTEFRLMGGVVGND